jgi:hypothetical protein
MMNASAATVRQSGWRDDVENAPDSQARRARVELQRALFDATLRKSFSF